MYTMKVPDRYEIYELERAAPGSARYAVSGTSAVRSALVHARAFDYKFSSHRSWQCLDTVLQEQ